MLFDEKNNVLLLQRHSYDRKYPDVNGAGKWCFPGGKNDGEDSFNCAIRELKEETSIELDIDPFAKFDLDETLSVYLYRLDYTPDVNLSNEHKSFIWVHPLDALSLNLVGPKTLYTLDVARQICELEVLRKSLGRNNA